MLQSEIRMCAGIGKSQNEDVVLNHVDKHPVILDVAITKTDKVSNESMVVKSLRKLLLRKLPPPNKKDYRGGYQNGFYRSGR